MNGRTWALTAALTATLVGCAPTSHASINACTQQIVDNVRSTAPNHYGNCDGLSDQDISTANTAALRALGDLS